MLIERDSYFFNAAITLINNVFTSWMKLLKFIQIFLQQMIIFFQRFCYTAMKNLVMISTHVSFVWLLSLYIQQEDLKYNFFIISVSICLYVFNDSLINHFSFCLKFFMLLCILHIWMHICVYACVYEDMYVRMCVYVCICKYICICVFMYVYICM